MNVVYYQKPKPIPTFKWASLVAGMILLVCCVAGALGTVFVRQGVMNAASEVKKIETELSNIQRRHNYLASKIATAHSPEYLVSRASKDLSLPKKDHVVWVKSEASVNSSVFLAGEVRAARATKLAFSNKIKGDDQRLN